MTKTEACLLFLEKWKTYLCGDRYDAYGNKVIVVFESMLQSKEIQNAMKEETTV